MPGMLPDRSIFDVILRCALYGNRDELARMLSRYALPFHRAAHALLLAAEKGHAECVGLLAPLSNLTSSRSVEALQSAAQLGHATCVELLIPFSNLDADYSRSLLFAAENGHAECVKLLIPVSDPKNVNSQSLRAAIAKGHVERAKLLLPVSHPLAERKGILLAALASGSAEARALLADSEPCLLDGVDLSASQEAAQASGNASLAEFLSSIIERQVLQKTLPPCRRAPLSTFEQSPLRSS